MNIESIKQFVTGKTKAQRESDRLALSIQRREIQKAQMEERGKQAVIFARERERIRTQAQIARLKQSYAPKKVSAYSSPFGSAGSPQAYSIFGGAKPGASSGSFNPISGGWSGGISKPSVKRKIRHKPRTRTRVVYRYVERR